MWHVGSVLYQFIKSFCISNIFAIKNNLFSLLWEGNKWDLLLFGERRFCGLQRFERNPFIIFNNYLKM